MRPVSCQNNHWGQGAEKWIVGVRESRSIGRLCLACILFGGTCPQCQQTQDRDRRITISRLFSAIHQGQSQPVLVRSSIKNKQTNKKMDSAQNTNHMALFCSSTKEELPCPEDRTQQARKCYLSFTVENGPLYGHHLTFLKDLFTFTISVLVFCLHGCLCTICMQYSSMPRRGHGSPGTAVVSHHLGTNNWTQVLWRSR